jgi:ATP-binding cassette subfamily F protein 2
MVCHSQDFLNNVCSHIVHLDHHTKKLDYYRGNYDTFVETRAEAATEQMRRYQAEQEDIKNMKEYVVWHQSLFEASCS